MRGAARRPVLAAALIAIALAGLLLAWFLTGWSGVHAQQLALRAAPSAEANRRGAELAHEMSGELTAIAERETQRAYYEYANLVHDPRTGNVTPSVAPGPLAGVPATPLVRGYFQLDAHGKVTTPTINDEHPELSEPTHAAGNRAFRDAVARDLAKPLAPGVLVAAALPSQRVNIDNNSYQQNRMPQEVFALQQAATPQEPFAAAGSVTITVSPLAWRTLAFDGGPALVAVRDVDTPDGQLVQGFVVDRAALARWLATRAGDVTASSCRATATTRSRRVGTSRSRRARASSQRLRSAPMPPRTASSCVSCSSACSRRRSACSS